MEDKSEICIIVKFKIQYIIVWSEMKEVYIYRSNGSYSMLGLTVLIFHFSNSTLLKWKSLTSKIKPYTYFLFMKKKGCIFHVITSNLICFLIFEVKSCQSFYFYFYSLSLFHTYPSKHLRNYKSCSLALWDVCQVFGFVLYVPGYFNMPYI